MLESVQSEELFFKLGEVDEKPSSSSVARMRVWMQHVMSAGSKASRQVDVVELASRELFHFPSSLQMTLGPALCLRSKDPTGSVGARDVGREGFSGSPVATRGLGDAATWRRLRYIDIYIYMHTYIPIFKYLFKHMYTHKTTYYAFPR